MHAILIAGFFAAWSLLSSTPNSSDIQASGDNQTPPTEYQRATSPHSPEIAAPSGSERQDANQYKSAHRNAFLSWCQRYQGAINLFSGILVAVFTGILTLYTILLWKSGEKHSERELRAYVFPVAFTIRNFKTTLSSVSTSQRISAFVKIKNTGQTPAYKFTCQVKMIVVPFPQTDFTFSKEEAEFTPGYLGPEGTLSYSPVKDTMLTREQAKHVIDGAWAIYVFGRIDYVDAFKVQRWTTFRTLARGDHGVMSVAEGGEDVLLLATDKEGNDAT
jgi:hypothetical protein